MKDVRDTIAPASPRRTARRTWAADNEKAIDAYNEQIAQRGVFSDDWRRF